MAQIYKEGEIKVRPDVYYRYSNKGAAKTAAIDGINAIVVKAPWGPIDEVRAFNDIEDIKAVYGTCIGYWRKGQVKSISTGPEAQAEPRHQPRSVMSR